MKRPAQREDQLQGPRHSLAKVPPVLLVLGKKEAAQRTCDHAGSAKMASSYGQLDQDALRSLPTRLCRAYLKRNPQRRPVRERLSRKDGVSHPSVNGFSFSPRAGRRCPTGAPADALAAMVALLPLLGLRLAAGLPADLSLNFERWRSMSRGLELQLGVLRQTAHSLEVSSSPRPPPASVQTARPAQAHRNAAAV